MLVKINDIDTNTNRVKVTQLDIDDLGSIVPVKELELGMSADEAIPLTLKNSSFAAIFTSENDENIIMANGMTLDELNQEKRKTIAKANPTYN
jgi:hypothetical protein